MRRRDKIQDNQFEDEDDDDQDEEELSYHKYESLTKMDQKEKTDQNRFRCSKDKFFP